MRPLALGSFELDLDSRTIGNDVEKLSLSPISARFLAILAQADGNVVRRADLIEELWGGNTLIGEPGLNRLVSETRNVLSRLPGGSELIQTVPRQGYRITRGQTPNHGSSGFAQDVRRWVGTALLLVLAAALLHWLIEGLTGLVWTLRASR